MNNSIQKNCLTAVLFFTAFILTSATYAEIVIIANKASPLTTAKTSDLKKVYLGKKNKINGTKVTPLNQINSSGLTKKFNKVVLNKTNSKVEVYWSKLIFSGKGKPPQELKNDAEVIEAVREDVDKIGYIDSSVVDDTIKVILTLK